ncbi:phosphate regulon transcriptional regulator PhoB [Alkalilacustris brevis]|uniref:phosphate regulon transcriptional regulator PhoB n=1 Tax=Alkalilacustris brevis TaxID=2026338 RepID=UPI000E0DA129|nr:phosphate regulon transcriptional regulator PhoB [Alkalilacustris brevis]
MAARRGDSSKPARATGAGLAPLVLVVDDEPAQRTLLGYNLEAAGFRVVTATDGEEALLLVAEHGPDIILLDWMLPHLSGVEVCRQLKARDDTRDIPVLMISARSEEDDRVRGLEIGADDYVTKPYSVNELVARVRANLRRTRPGAVGRVLEVGDITLDPERHQVFRAGAEIHLGPTEYRLLATFMERPGRVFSREMLLDRVWGRDIYVDSRTVDVHVGRLRKALRAHGGDDPLRTVRGAGYALG